MDTTNAQTSPRQHPKPIGRVLARILAEEQSRPVGFWPMETITMGIPNIHDTDF